MFSAVRGDDVTDVDAAFVADPFALRFGDAWFLFFEVLNRRAGKGEIALATSSDLHRWSYQGVVIRQPMHLSYPHVFEADGEFYMTPECWESGAVLLYRASSWPDQWELVGRLIEGPVLLDPTPFRWGGKWWLFVETDRGHSYGTLRLYSASHLLGPWVEHPESPVISRDPSSSRPGGRVFVVDGSPVRIAQDCSERYGDSVGLFQIDYLDALSYAETFKGRVDATTLVKSAGTKGIMHHLDVHALGDGRWVSFFDMVPD